MEAANTELAAAVGDAEAEAEQDGTYELIRDKWLDGSAPSRDGTTAISGFAAKQSPSALADAA